MDIIIVPPAPKLVHISNWNPTQLVGIEAFRLPERKLYWDPEEELVDKFPPRTALHSVVTAVCFVRKVAAKNLVAELAESGYKMVDSFTQMDINRSQLTFADDFPNAVQHLIDGKFVYSVVDRWDGEREVHVNRDGRYWAGGHFFLCVAI